MDSTHIYITANIQGMFNLEQKIAEEYKKLSEIVKTFPFEEFDGAFSVQDDIVYGLCEDHRRLLERFTPMQCKYCTLKDKCNFTRDVGVCSEYTVKVETDYGYDRNYC